MLPLGLDVLKPRTPRSGQGACGLEFGRHDVKGNGRLGLSTATSSHFESRDAIPILRPEVRLARPGVPVLTSWTERPGIVATWQGQPVLPRVLHLVPESLAREELAVPIAVDGEAVAFDVVDLDDIAMADKPSFVIAREVRLIRASLNDIATFIDQQYGPVDSDSESLSSMLRDLSPDDFDTDSISIRLFAAPLAPPPVPQGTEASGAESEGPSPSQVR